MFRRSMLVSSLAVVAGLAAGLFAAAPTAAGSSPTTASRPTSPSAKAGDGLELHGVDGIDVSSGSEGELLLFDVPAN